MYRTKLAADQGDAIAQSNLASTYYDGTGVPQDFGETFRLFKLATERGQARAQSNLGSMYANAIGVPQDYAEAVKWCRLAADQDTHSPRTNSV